MPRLEWVLEESFMRLEDPIVDEESFILLLLEEDLDGDR